MKRRHLFSTVYRSEEGINISPLIDIVFILLIFFIVTSVFQRQQSLEIRKPQASSSAALENDAIFIAITQDQQIRLGGKSVGLGGIAPALERMAGASHRPVVVEVDRSVPSELLIHVVDQIRLTGNEAVHVATESR